LDSRNVLQSLTQGEDMLSQRFGIFVSWWSRFCLISLALLAIVACLDDNGQNGEASETVSRISAASFCPDVFAPATAVSARDFDFSKLLPTPNTTLSSCEQDKDGNVTIGTGNCGPNVYVDQTQTIKGVITIAKDGELVFPQDALLTLTTTAIIVNGVFSAGT